MPSRTVMHLHALSDFPTHLHTPGVHLLTSALGDIITAMSFVDVTRQLADVIVDQDVDQIVDLR